MKATALDLRYKMKEIIRALGRGEKVQLMYHGHEKGVVIPGESHKPVAKPSDHESFGMWKKHQGMGNVKRFVDSQRKSRFHAV